MKNSILIFFLLTLAFSAFGQRRINPEKQIRKSPSNDPGYVLLSGAQGEYDDALLDTLLGLGIDTAYCTTDSCFIVTMTGDTLYMGLASGKVVRFSADNFATLEPSSPAISVGTAGFDRRRGSWYYYNGSSWSARETNNGEAADTPWAVVGNDSLTGWDVALYNRGQLTISALEPDSVWIPRPTNYLSQTPGEKIVVDVWNNQLADTMTVYFDSIFRKFNQTLLVSFNVPPKARLQFVFKVNPSVEGVAWVSVDDVQEAPDVPLAPPIDFGGVMTTDVQEGLEAIDARLDSAFTNTEYLNVADYGVTADNGQDQYDSLKVAFTAALAQEKGVYFPPGVYDLSHGISMNSTSVLKVRGYGATWRRMHGDSTQATLTSGAAVGASTMNVSDGTRFRATNRYLLLDSSTPYAGRKDGEAVVVQVLSIVGNVITLTSPITAPTANPGLVTFPSGTIIVNNNTFFYTDNIVSHWEGLTFDGNRDSSNNLVNSWSAVNSLKLRSYSTVRNCTFLRTPSESVVFGVGCVFDNNITRDANGSGVHMSTSDTSDVTTYITNSIFDDVCKATHAITQHSEGAITHSVGGANLVVDGCFFDTGQESVIGSFTSSAPSNNVKVTNCTMRDFPAVLEVYVGTSDAQVKNFIFSNNFVYDCGYIGVYNLNESVQFIISNNTFENFSLKAQCKGLQFNNNIIRNAVSYVPPYENADYRSLLKSIFGSATSKGLIQFYNSNDIQCIGNSIINASGAYSDSAPVAINFGDQANENIICSDNHIENYVSGIAFGRPGETQTSVGRNRKNGIVANNTIKLQHSTVTEDADNYIGVGIQARPGITVKGNTIEMDTNSVFGIYVLGTGVSAGGDNADSRSTDVSGNYIWGSSTTDSCIYIPADSEYGLIITGNVYRGEKLSTITSRLVTDVVKNRWVYGNIRRNSDGTENIVLTGTSLTNGILPKYNSTTARLENSNLTDNGTTVTSAVDMSINTRRFGAGGGNISTNMFSGNLSGESNTTGSLNSGFGNQSLRLNTTGSSNTAVGFQSMTSNTTGGTCTAIGGGSLYANTTGVNNIAVGGSALAANTTGNNNSAIGLNSLASSTTASGNSAVGLNALLAITTGGSNTALGSSAGRYAGAYGTTANQTTGNSVYVGVNTRASANAVTNENVFGYAAVGIGSNTVQVGDTNVVKVGLGYLKFKTLILGSGDDGKVLAYNHSTGLIEPTAAVDGSVTNEGALTVGAGGANSAKIVSNTSGSKAVTIQGGTRIAVLDADSTITLNIADTVWIKLTPLGFSDSLKTVQELGNDYFNVPAELNGYKMAKVEYSVIAAGAGTGDVIVGLKAYTSTRTTSYVNAYASTFSAGDFIETITGSTTIATGQLLVSQITTDTIVTHPRGMCVMLMLTKQ